MGGEEGWEEGRGGRVDVDVDVDRGVGVEFMEGMVEGLWEVIVRGVGEGESGEEGDGVLVRGLNDGFGVDKEVRGGDRDVREVEMGVGGEFMGGDL